MRRFNRITTIFVDVAAGVARWIVLIGRNDGQPQILADWPQVPPEGRLARIRGDVRLPRLRHCIWS
jgi:hypothetical protein